MTTIFVLENPSTGDYVSVWGFGRSGEGWTDTTTFAMPFASEEDAWQWQRMAGCNARPVAVRREDVLYADSYC